MIAASVNGVVQARRVADAEAAARDLTIQRDALVAARAADERAMRQAAEAAGRFTADLGGVLQTVDEDGGVEHELVYRAGEIGERLLSDRKLARSALDARAGHVAELGDKAIARGDVEAARRAYTDADAILRDLLEANPRDDVLMSHQAACRVRIAELAIRAGDDARAERYLAFAETVLYNVAALGDATEGPERARAARGRRRAARGHRGAAR